MLAQADEALAASIAELQTLSEKHSATATLLQEQIDELTAGIDTLTEDIDDLDDLVDDLEDTVVYSTFTIWEPLFVTQTSNFNQTRHPLFDGVQLDAMQTRAVNVTSETTTITVTSTELIEAVDVNSDNDHADALIATYPETVYTGTVSGTSTVVGTHTSTGTLSDWVVSSNN